MNGDYLEGVFSRYDSTGRSYRSEQLIRMNMDKFLPFGGLIADTVLEKASEAYGRDTVDYALKKWPQEELNFEMLELIYKLNMCFSNYDGTSYSGEGIEFNEFREWYYDRCIRFADEQDESYKEPFWQTRHISSDLQSRIMYVMPVEEKVVRLYWGIDGKRMSVEEIARLPEFDCRVEWIEAVLKGVEETFDSDEEAYLEFMALCESLAEEKNKGEI